MPEARGAYLDAMEETLGASLAGQVLLDKNPNHTSLLPAFLRLFPEGRIVLVLRDPRDVVTSAVLRTFALTEFSAMLLDWGTATELYASEMACWLQLRPHLASESWVEIRYEDVVADLGREARRAVGALGLPWDDVVLDYRRGIATKLVNSPTQTEVRQPVTDRAIGRWRHYEPELAPHLDRLAPFVRAFGYD